MRVTGPFENIARGGSRTSAVSLHALKKASISSHLDDDARGFTPRREKLSPIARAEPVCQDGTRTTDPFWDGPRLVPSFVAQLLGQAMPDLSVARKSSAQAYGASVPQIAGLLDRRS